MPIKAYGLKTLLSTVKVSEPRSDTVLVSSVQQALRKTEECHTHTQIPVIQFHTAWSASLSHAAGHLAETPVHCVPSASVTPSSAKLLQITTSHVLHIANAFSHDTTIHGYKLGFGFVTFFSDTFLKLYITCSDAVKVKFIICAWS